ncbi:family 43 glycosylhydrolase [Paenibacillus sp. VCA1]|uniref:family 43 glycosylhydrolase n=1 Tax=Paenibacillus sp. VCA1 TaxID=3039148 RepID=UPI00287268CD|nr:family 43 glycosylhydrolase [Paenibacillus sp. VCA1]MDR9855556.1 family 43 glycosylhydrolase [Paenibacillus sp. VCA1]
MKQNGKVWGLIGVSLATAVAAVAATVFVLKNNNGNEQTSGGEIAMKQTYQNPMKLDQEWEDYGIGDPYVLRFNGKYYLYCSTKDWRVGIKAWSSEDLIHWKYEGLVTEDPLTEGAYAPEVVYWNGSFYMYTSPGGKGHYVLRSDSPTGPFKVETDNLGLSIDGSVFIDDDAKWYFTHAAPGGIMASLMEDPYTMGPEDKLNTSLGHWTEGSMIIKRQGRYFITYTGNHVFSRGYRVNYAVAHDSPNGIYTIPDNNPILISTKDDFNGLGHSSTVMGPDMDSYYIVYHNLAGRSAEGPPVRMMNMDRLLFNGDKMSVAGPTHGMPVQAPARPAFYDYLTGLPGEDHWEHQETQQNKETWITKDSTNSKFTAEFNAVISEREDQKASDSRAFEALFSYQDADRFRGIRVDMDSKTLSLFEVEQGKERVVQTGDLPKGMDLTKHHTLRAESDQEGTLVYWDGLLLLSDKQMKGVAGAIGYRWSTALNPTLGYTAFSNEAGGSSDHKVLHPLPGTMEAIHGIRGEDDGRTFSVNDGDAPDGSCSVTLLKNDSELTFPVYVKEEGTYLISAMVAQGSAGGKLTVHAGGKRKEIPLKAEDFSNESEWSKIPLASFHLGKGPQWISLSKEKGEVSIRYIEADKTVPAPTRQTVEFTDRFGSWDVSGEQITLQSEAREGKLFGGDSDWSDYEVNLQLTPTGEAPSKAALLFRTANESDFKDQVNDSFMGYELSFNNGFVRLNRINYDVNEEKASELLELENNKAVNIRVRLEGAAISVFIGDSKKPLLTWTDPNAFLTGRVGLRTASQGWLFSPVTVTPIK